MSPFKSKAQMRKFADLVKEGKMKQETFDKWAIETKDTDSLPERLPEEGDPITSIDQLRVIAKAKVIK